MKTLVDSQFEKDNFKTSNEFSSLDFNDERLNKRIVKIAEAFNHAYSKSVRDMVSYQSNVTLWAILSEEKNPPKGCRADSVTAFDDDPH